MVRRTVNLVSYGDKDTKLSESISPLVEQIGQWHFHILVCHDLNWTHHVVDCRLLAIVCRCSRSLSANFGVDYLLCRNNSRYFVVVVCEMGDVDFLGRTRRSNMRLMP